MNSTSPLSSLSPANAGTGIRSGNNAPAASEPGFAKALQQANARQREPVREANRSSASERPSDPPENARAEATASTAQSADEADRDAQAAGEDNDESTDSAAATIANWWPWSPSPLATRLTPAEPGGWPASAGTATLPALLPQPAAAPMAGQPVVGQTATDLAAAPGATPDAGPALGSSPTPAANEPLPAAFQALLMARVGEAVDAAPRSPEAPTATNVTPLQPLGALHAGNLLPAVATVNPANASTPDLHGQRFPEEVATQLSWMADQKIGHANIRINPHELGPVEIRLKLDGDRIHADFSSAQPEVRQALESGMGRLRDMLGQQGFQLAHADVGHRQSDTPPRPSARADADRTDIDPLAPTGPAVEAPRIIRNGLLDAYA